MKSKQVACECGHENPYRTELCEACGTRWPMEQMTRRPEDPPFEHAL